MRTKTREGDKPRWDGYGQPDLTKEVRRIAHAGSEMRQAIGPLFTVDLMQSD
jgi:hypothetical protein